MGVSKNDEDSFTVNLIFESAMLIRQVKNLFLKEFFEALKILTERYLKPNKKLHLKHLSEDYRSLLANAGEIIDVKIIEDPYYRLLADKI